MSETSKSAVWQKLQQHYQNMADKRISDLFKEDSKRYDEFTFEAAGLFLDYSKNLVTAETMKLLVQLAETVKIQEQAERMFTGAKINITENRAVLHTALRNPNADASIMVDGDNVMPQIHTTLDKMLKTAENIRKGKWHGQTKKAITDVVNIGIGGSDLGPAMVYEALKPYAAENITCHFVSNVDSTHIVETLKYLNPETTLFIVSSKTFTTQETLTNANTAREWLEQKLSAKAVAKHMIAVTAAPKYAEEFGIETNNIYPFWDWVGGRYSLWSAIGFSIAIAVGAANFQELLAGAFAMDQHFRTAPLTQNMPVVLGLIGIWNSNFLGAKTQAILPYDQSLHLLPAYLQQLEMESNGKHVDINGKDLDYTTAPVIWGSAGTNGQHAFHQLLMQGTQLVPADFILPLKSQNPIGQHQMFLVANCLAQSQALMQGKSESQVIQELLDSGLDEVEARKLAPHKVIPGNNPSSTITMDKLTPETLGALIALYEHKVFVQGVIWNINSFDQWGVELGKQLTKNIIPPLQGASEIDSLDASTQALIQRYLDAYQ